MDFCLDLEVKRRERNDGLTSGLVTELVSASFGGNNLLPPPDVLYLPKQYNGKQVVYNPSSLWKDVQGVENSYISFREVTDGILRTDEFMALSEENRANYMPFPCSNLFGSGAVSETGQDGDYYYEITSFVCDVNDSNSNVELVDGEYRLKSYDDSDWCFSGQYKGEMPVFTDERPEDQSLDDCVFKKGSKRYYLINHDEHINYAFARVWIKRLGSEPGVRDSLFRIRVVVPKIGLDYWNVNGSGTISGEDTYSSDLINDLNNVYCFYCMNPSFMGDFSNNGMDGQPQTFEGHVRFCADDLKAILGVSFRPQNAERYYNGYGFGFAVGPCCVDGEVVGAYYAGPGLPGSADVLDERGIIIGQVGLKLHAGTFQLQWE